MLLGEGTARSLRCSGASRTGLTRPMGDSEVCAHDTHEGQAIEDGGVATEHEAELPYRSLVERVPAIVYVDPAGPRADLTRPT